MKTQIYADTRRYKSKSRIKILSVSICVHLCLIAFAFPGFVQAQETITVAVASSLYGDMQQQARAFEKNHDVTIRLIPGSTGRLYNQIIQGAPFDVFIAADAQRPAMLAKQGRVIEVHQVGQGYLGVMIGHRVVSDPAVLTDVSIRHIAIANPDVAPFGQVTKAVLQRQGLWQKLKHKFVYAQNAMQATMMLNKGLVDAGFVPVSSDNAFMATLPYVGVLLTDKSQTHDFMQAIKQKYLRLAPGGATSVAQKTYHASATNIPGCPLCCKQHSPCVAPPAVLLK